jgi:CTP:molybdopterin cytidylyltransferase MocA
MDVVVSVGSVLGPDDPLYKHARGNPKALLKIHGKTMIQWVLEAVAGASSVERIVVVGLPNNSVVCSKPIFVLPNQGSMLKNVRAGFAKIVEMNPTAQYALHVLSDIPAITPRIVDWAIHTTEGTDRDLCHFVVPRANMERLFPHARYYTRYSTRRLKDIEWIDGNMHVFRIAAAMDNDRLWQRAEEGRRSSLRRISMIIDYLGWTTLIEIMMGKIDSNRLVNRIAERTGLKVGLFLCPHAEAAMDVDHPDDLERLRSYLEEKD